MILLIGNVARVTSKQKTDEQGKPFDEYHAHIQHSANLSSDSDILIDKIKLKSSPQVTAFRNSLGKEIQVPVRVWNQGGKFGYWLEEGVLPTVQQAKAAS